MSFRSPLDFTKRPLDATRILLLDLPSGDRLHQADPRQLVADMAHQDPAEAVNTLLEMLETIEKSVANRP